MNQLTIVPTFPALQSAALERLHGYLDNHGASLNSLISQARADADVEEQAALRDLSEAATASRDARTLVLRLRTVIDELLCVIGEPLAEIEGAFSGPDFDNALCWHASRLTDVRRDIKFAFRV